MKRNTINLVLLQPFSVEIYIWNSRLTQQRRGTNDKRDLERHLPSCLPPLGRDDFNFSSWILSASPHIAPVTERNTLDYMVLVWGVCYTPHKRYPCDRILFRCVKTGFLVSHSLNLIGSLLYSPQPPQLPRETLWIGWIWPWGWSTPPTSEHIVTEMTLTGRKAHFRF